MVKIKLIPVEVFGAEDGYGLMDAVSWWGDCNRAVGKIYRVEDLDVPDDTRKTGETVEVWVKKSDLPFFEKRWGRK